MISRYLPDWKWFSMIFHFPWPGLCIHGIFTYFYMSSVTPRLEILPRSIAAALPWSRCPAPPRSRAPRCLGNPVDPWQTSATRLVVDHWSQKATWSNKVLKLMHIGKACEIMMVSYGSWWFMMVWYFRTFGYFWGQRHPKVIEGFVTTWFGQRKGCNKAAPTSLSLGRGWGFWPTRWNQWGSCGSPWGCPNTLDCCKTPASTHRRQPRCGFLPHHPRWKKWCSLQGQNRK